VILLENSNEWNLSPVKEGSSKKREQGLKSKKCETSYKEAPCLKKRGDEIYKLLGEILSKERKEGDHIFL
jgi:hypothetical protein